MARFEPILAESEMPREHVLSSIIHFPSWSATATVPPKLSRADQEAALTAAGHRSLTLGQSPVDLLTTGAE
ncbi:hypothetical protein TNIN_142451 [Trichonephila inaurata madagascariensis]|uniref:Uncharacterized protein n=1 Tax=Trichonephila inaurata madagascariensis TaxID=2747483 RepID=A0A8X7CDS9_9ARAC|nr:hypothetical protein TNIN_142451 [Trichonephila inaurata madagascariensis]